MAVIGSLLLNDTDDAGLMFAVSEEVVRTLSNWQWSGSARYATHQRHCGNALTEFVGLDPDEITFDITLNPQLGTSPISDISQLLKYERGGLAVALTIGGHGYGRYRWNVVSHSTKIEYTDRNGAIYHAVVSVTLKEYLRE